MTTTRFTVTDEHMALLRRMNVGWDDCEYGAPAIDCKRPYGNSSVPQDIYKILGWEYDEDEGVDWADERAGTIHAEMQTVLQILVTNAHVEYGDYVREDFGDWKPLEWPVPG